MRKSTLRTAQITTTPLLLLVAAIVGASAATLPPTGPEVADAAQRQDNAALREFVRQHVAVNTPQVDGTTALQWAAHWNDTETVKLLIGAGADVKDGQPLRCDAAIRGCGSRKRNMIEML